jgi:hypothetical protein
MHAHRPPRRRGRPDRPGPSGPPGRPDATVLFQPLGPVADLDALTDALVAHAQRHGGVYDLPPMLAAAKRGETGLCGVIMPLLIDGGGPAIQMARDAVLLLLDEQSPFAGAPTMAALCVEGWGAKFGSAEVANLPRPERRLMERIQRNEIGVSQLPAHMRTEHLIAYAQDRVTARELHRLWEIVREPLPPDRPGGRPQERRVFVRQDRELQTHTRFAPMWPGVPTRLGMDTAPDPDDWPGAGPPA